MSFAVMAVGVFTKDFTIANGIVTSVAFFLSALASLTSARILKVIPSLEGLVLGATTFRALALFSLGRTRIQISRAWASLSDKTDLNFMK